ncbi:MAG: phytanoyl-CoA dioxygenase family protein [Candidatus Latescibacterota bacterium]|nr:phytanoyl-CoA dioxygenase family protein [Candidatus Latescibacterota bacterium]
MPPLTQQQLDHFHDKGYLVVRGLLDPASVLDPVIREYEGVLDRLAHELHAAGTIPSAYEELPFQQRLTRVYQDSGKVHAQYFDFSLPQGSVQPDTPFWAGPAVFRTLVNEDLLDAVESFVGPEIYSNPVQHVRLKPPERLTPMNPDTGLPQLGATAWHQDNGVVLPEADDGDILTVWFSLTDASIEHGCLQVFPESHRRGLLHHCRRPTGLTVAESFLPTVNPVALPMKPGDVLFLTQLTCHSSLSNVTDEVRWSFDLRYQPIGEPTGRPAFPGFVARSRQHPDSEMRDPAEWERLWRDTRDRMALHQEKGPFNRWNVEDGVCA